MTGVETDNLLEETSATSSLNEPGLVDTRHSSDVQETECGVNTAAPTSSSLMHAMAGAGYSNFFQTDASTMLRMMNELERKLKDVHTAPQWLPVVFAKLKKLDELEECVHKLQLTAPLDSLDELFRTNQVERYSEMLRDQYLSKEGTVASELYARVLALELEQERLQKLLSARPTVIDMQVLKDMHMEHFRSVERQLENSHSLLQSHLQGMFAAELEEFHNWRRSQEEVLQSKIKALQMDTGLLSSAKHAQLSMLEEMRTCTTENIEKMQADMVAYYDELTERMATLQRETGEVVAQTAALAEQTQLQKEEMAHVTHSIEVKLGDLDKKASELDTFIHTVQIKAREDVLDVKKIAQLSRANMSELVAHHDNLEEAIAQGKQEMKQEGAKLLELIGGLTIEVRSANETHTAERAQLEQKMLHDLTIARGKMEELSTQVKVISQDLGNMLMSIASMPGQINALELHMRQVTEEVTNSLVRMDRLDGAVGKHEDKLRKVFETVENLRNSCYALQEADVQMNFTLENACHNIAALQKHVDHDRERVASQLSAIENGVDTLSTSFANLQDSIEKQSKQEHDSTDLQLQKLSHEVDKVRRALEELPRSFSGGGKTPAAGRLRSMTTAVRDETLSAGISGDHDRGKQPGRHTSSWQTESAAAANDSANPNASSLGSSAASSVRFKTENLSDLPGAIAASMCNPIKQEIGPGASAGVGKALEDDNNSRTKADIGHEHQGEEEEEKQNEADPVQDAVHFFSELCLSFEEIAVRKTAVPELNSVLCSQITAVAQETSNYLASAADAEIISRVLRAKPSEVTYDDMISEQRINLLSNFQAQISDHVKRSSPAAAGIIRMEARDVFLKKVRIALDIAMSKHEQVLVTAHSRLGRVAIPTCIACDRPLLNRHLHLHLHRSMYGSDQEHDFVEGSLSFMSQSNDESTLPIPTNESWKMEPQQPVQLLGRRHISTADQRFIKRGGGFKMQRPATRGFEVLPSAFSNRNSPFST